MLNCAICADIILASDNSSTTRCGHLFHSNCLSRWLANNHSCPQCRQISDKNTVPIRVYLPDHQFESNDLLEKLNEISMQKKDQETVIKNLESQKRKLEYELKVKKKQYHKVLQRQKFEKHGKGVNIPRAKQQAGPSTSSSSSTSTAAATSNRSSTTNEKAPSSSNTSRHKRNFTRIMRSKEYFRQKRAAHRNNNNTNNNNNASADRPPNVAIE